jgi:hypothetical protein
LVMVVLRSSEMSAFTRVTRYNIPVHSHRRENLKSYILFQNFRQSKSTNGNNLQEEEEGWGREVEDRIMTCLNIYQKWREVHMITNWTHNKLVCHPQNHMFGDSMSCGYCVGEDGRLNLRKMTFWEVLDSFRMLFINIYFELQMDLYLVTVVLQ